jgi:hypothetical protein
MNILPSVTGIVAEMRERFGDRLRAVNAPRPNEIYFDAGLDLVAGFSAHLYKNCDARLTGVFADDVCDTEKVFHVYYLFALDAAMPFLFCVCRCLRTNRNSPRSPMPYRP